MSKVTPMRAIRAKCLDCCCGSQMEVRTCPAENCPLYPYRFGKRPKVGNCIPNGISTEKSLASSVVAGTEGE